jgi:hypothetical protein
MATENVNTPAAPGHLPAKIQSQWTASYTKAFTQAQRDFPDDIRSQRTAALKAANRLLSIPAPTSADEINALKDWQVLSRGERGGVVFCVTADGQKYSFPVAAPDPASKK